MTDKPDVFEEVKLLLTERSSRSVTLGTELTGLSAGDFINQAVQVRAYIAHVLDTGGSLYTRKSPDAEYEPLHFTAGDDTPATDEIGNLLGD